MMKQILNRLQRPIRSKPDPAFIAQQLRRPSGDFAPKIAHKMNEVNMPLYQLVFDAMPLQKNDRILEVGFGNGKHFDALIRKAPGLRVSAIDFSAKMVAAANENNKGAIDAGALEIYQGNSMQLPFPDQVFDHVLCNMVVYFWDQPEGHLKEINRVLKPGGTFYTGMRSRKSMLFFPFVKFGFTLYSINEWKEILIENEFEFMGIQKRLDPAIEINDRQRRLESYCVMAKK